MKNIEVKQQTDQSITLCSIHDTYCITPITDGVVHCVYTKRNEILDESPLEIKAKCETSFSVQDTKKDIIITTARLQLVIDKSTGAFTWETKDGALLLQEKEKELTEVPYYIYSTGDEKPVIRREHTVDGERNFVENLKPVEDHKAYHGKLNFDWDDEEQIHGLGQGEEGIFNYRGKTQYLYQHNMRIPIPFFVSDKGYAILVDCGSLMTFNDDERGSYLYLDSVEQLDYYFIYGPQMDQIIKAYRMLTGKAVMLPKWSYGYIQSKEAYHTQQEMIDIAKEYRNRGIGLDCVVQDWNTWEDGAWGNKQVDKKRYPNLKEMNDTLHDMHVHSMVSIWPNMNSGTPNHTKMENHGLLLNDYATYDAFDEKGREIYWNQMKEELFSGGFDSWWCDSTEPFSGPDWNGEYKREPWERYELVGGEHKKFLGAGRANLYAVTHAKGVYENQRKENDKKRVLNLTRSGYASSQKYGTMLWSGDTCATWENLRKQITEGLNMSLSGMPYWTLDIGAFFTVNHEWKNRGCGCNTDPTPKWFWRGDYENGVVDLGYRELYVRWLQYGVFLPMFRSHGTDTPREIWNFGKPGEPFYEAIEKAIELRYQLMPYIYSLAGRVWMDDYTMMRPLIFDYPQDSCAATRFDEFMFGDDLLICPITKPMYYDKNSKELHIKHEWQCYLPEGNEWYDFYTNQTYAGGQNITIEATLEHIPVFVKAGAILPMEEKLIYADEKVDTPLYIRIYPGCDGTFLYYEDEGDGYGYENGQYHRITMTWSQDSHTLTLGAVEGAYSGGILKRTCIAICGEKTQSFQYTGEILEVHL